MIIFVDDSNNPSDNISDIAVIISEKKDKRLSLGGNKWANMY